MGLIGDAWNNSLIVKNDITPRSHIRASELGRSYIDRYYSMIGEPPSNPFSIRVLRIFDAGRVVEFMVLRALTMAGILNRKGDLLELPETETHLSVHGRLDATIGGITDWDKAEALVRENLDKYTLDLGSEMLEERAMGILSGLRKEYPKGWPEEMLVEVKSINSMSFWANKKNAVGGRFLGYDHNLLQLYAYLKMSGLRQGILLYVSKDDLTLEEVSVQAGDPELEEAFNKDITTMTSYFRSGTVPPKEKPLSFNDRKRAFEINWDVSRSLYLTKIYGFSDPGALDDHYHQLILDLNRALRHLRDGKLKPEDEELVEKYKLERYM